MRRYLRPAWLALYFVVLLGWAAWYVPRLSAERYREALHQGLEKALGRKVEFGTIAFQLLPVPGFTISDLNVGEDPAIGPEPTAYITTLRGRPRISALFGGPLEFASVVLEDASVNLTRAEGDSSAVRWNFSSLTKARLNAAFPTVHMVGGRVNFKFGDTKTVFYLLNTDADLWPPDAEGGPWTLKVRAEPARTDRPSRGFGSFTARGEWRPKDGAITVDVKLEKSELSDVATLFQGSESGLHGHIWGEAHLAGPADRVGLAGRLNIDDIHGWNQTPPATGKPFPVVLSGAVDARNQVVDIRAVSGVSGVPLDLRYRVQDLLGRPRWALTALLDGMPLGPMVDVARHLGWGIPEDLAIEGTALGVLGYSLTSDPPRLDGGVRFTGVTVTPRGAPALKITDTELTVQGSKALLGATTVTASNGESATLGAGYDFATGAFESDIRTDGMAVQTLRPLLGGAPVPLIGQVTGGVWNGHLHSAGIPTVWTGEVRVKEADLRFDAFADPIRITTADVDLDSNGTNIKKLAVAVAGVEVQGEYRYLLGAAVPHQFRLTAGTVDGSAVEKLLAPTLNRASLLNKALNLGKVPVPDWMHALRAEGTLQFGSLVLGPVTLNRLRTRLEWNGETVTLAGLQAQAGTTIISGAVVTDLSGAQPRFEFTGKAAGIAWRGGLIEAVGAVTTSGAGSDLLTKLTAKGAFTARNLDLSPSPAFSLAHGEFDLSWGKGVPHLTLTPLTATAGGSNWTGTAETRDSGEVVLKLASGPKQIQAAGAIFKGEPLKLASTATP